ncbi:MAG: hypothetical protein ACXV3E_07155 [Halobacteriota archaeon]
MLSEAKKGFLANAPHFSAGLLAGTFDVAFAASSQRMCPAGLVIELLELCRGSFLAVCTRHGT